MNNTNKRTGKKGQILLYGLFAGMIAAIIVSIISNNVVKNEFPGIGRYSLELVKASAEADKTMAFLDTAAWHSSSKSIKELSDSGWTQDGNPCGYYMGHSMWNNIGLSQLQCYPTSSSAKSLFSRNFNAHMSAHISAFNKASMQKIPEGKFGEIRFTGGRIEGAYDKTLTYNISTGRKSAAPYGNYTVRPAFTVQPQYDFAEIDSIAGISKDIVNSCSGSTDKASCLKSSLRWFSDKGFAVNDNCQSKEEKEFYIFVEYVKTCHESEKSGCVCSGKPQGTSLFSLENTENAITIKSTINRKNFEAKITGAKLSDNNLFTFNPGLEYFAHKDNSGSILIEKKLDTQESCTIRQQDTFSICIDSGMYSIYAHDAAGNAAKAPVRHRFAIQIPDLRQQSSQPASVFPQPLPENQPSITAEIPSDVNSFFSPVTYTLALADGNPEKNLQISDYIASMLSASNTKQLRSDSNYKGDQAYLDIVNAITYYPIDTTLILISTKQPEGNTISYDKKNVWAYLLAVKIEKHLGAAFTKSESAEPLLTGAKPVAIRVNIADYDANINGRIAEGINDYFQFRTKDMQFTFSDSIKNYAQGRQEGLVNHDWIYEIAKKENVNFDLLYGMMKTESRLSYLCSAAIPSGDNSKCSGTTTAHGLGQFFTAATQQVLPDLAAEYPHLAGKTAQEVYSANFISEKPEDLKAQISALAKYLKWVRRYMESSGKNSNTQTIAQAYHDGIGNIEKDGRSKMITDNKDEAKYYYAHIASNSGFT